HRHTMSLETQKSFDDPFDDPSLVTTAFLDIMWQDENGMSALMAAAQDNRLLHVKGILNLAQSSSRLKQCMDLRSNMDQTALEIARNCGHADVVRVMEKYARGHYRRKQRASRSVAAEMANKYKAAAAHGASEDDIMLEIEANSVLSPPPPSSFIFRPMPLSRTKMPNGTKPKSAVGRSRPIIRSSSHLSRMRQNTQSIDTDDERKEEEEEQKMKVTEKRKTSSAVATRRGTEPNHGGIMHNVAEKFRTLMRFSTNDSSTFSDALSPEEQMKSNQDSSLPGLPSSTATTATVRSPESKKDGGFDDLSPANGRFPRAPWNKQSLSSSYGGSSGNGLKLPPILGLRRRTTSEGRRAEKFVVADGDN
ncbi:hypothetical protein PFISCL1PPCAC_6804, partial [Pristionchus fissidentatus]